MGDNLNTVFLFVFELHPRCSLPLLHSSIISPYFAIEPAIGAFQCNSPASATLRTLSVIMAPRVSLLVFLWGTYQSLTSTSTVVMAAQERPPLNPVIVKLDNYVLQYTGNAPPLSCAEIKSTALQCFENAVESGICGGESWSVYFAMVRETTCEGTQATLKGVEFIIENTGLDEDPTEEVMSNCLLLSFDQPFCREAFGSSVVGIVTAPPTQFPSSAPTLSPSASPTTVPTSAPSRLPTDVPTSSPSRVPTPMPSGSPTVISSSEPTLVASSSPTLEPSTFPSIQPTISSVPTTDTPSSTGFSGIGRDAETPSSDDKDLTLPLAISVAAACSLAFLALFLYRRHQSQSENQVWRRDSPLSAAGSRQMPADEEIGIRGKDHLATTSDAGASTIAFGNMLEEAAIEQHAMADDLSDQPTNDETNKRESIECILKSHEELDQIMAVLPYDYSDDEKDDDSLPGSRASTHLMGEDIVSMAGSSVATDPKMIAALKESIQATEIANEEEESTVEEISKIGRDKEAHAAVVPKPSDAGPSEPNEKTNMNTNEENFTVNEMDTVVEDSLTRNMKPTQVQKKDLRYPYNYTRELSSDSGDSFLNELDNMSDEEDAYQGQQDMEENSSVSSSSESGESSVVESKRLLSSFRTKMQWRKVKVPPETRDEDREPRVHL